jgi:hypothetical protein
LNAGGTDRMNITLRSIGDAVVTTANADGSSA